MDLKQYKIFIYDKSLRPDEFMKICQVDFLLYEPAFAELRLTSNDIHGINAIDSSWSSKTNITFGTLYTVELSDIQYENLLLYNLSSNIKKLTTIDVRCIRFDSIKDFLQQKFEIVDRTKALSFLLDLSSERGKLISENRHFYAGNLCKEFLQTYRNY